MLLPLSADQDTIRLPRVTLILIGVNALIYLFSSHLEGAGLEAFCNFFGLVPARVLSRDFIVWYKTFPFLTSMFLHGSFLHLAGNSIFLYVFGCELENRFGPRKYLYFYLLSGIYSGLFYVACQWQSPIPVIGASGAISGLMGGVLILLPLKKIRLFFMSLFPFYARVVEVPAYICVSLYFIMQVIFAFIDRGSGIAYWGHVGGFIGGVALSMLVMTRPFAHPLKLKKKNLLVLGRTRPAHPQPRHEFVWNAARAIGFGIMRSKTVFRIIVGIFTVYLLVLLNYYVFGVSARWAIAYTVVESVFILLPLVYLLFLNKAVHEGLSSFFGSFFSLLYEGRSDHEKRPDIYRAQSLEQKEDYLGAVREYRKIFARFPDRIDIVYRIAEIYRNKLKDREKAAGSYRMLLTYPEEGKYAYCIRHARELLRQFETEPPNDPEPAGGGAMKTEDGFREGGF